MTAPGNGSQQTPARQNRDVLHIVAGVDGGPEGWAALRQATDLAGRLGARLEVVHIVTIDDLAGVAPSGWGAAPLPPRTPEELTAVDQTVRRVADEAAGILRGRSVDWAFHSRRGDPERILSELAEQSDAYCIVIGTRGEGFGAFLERLIRPSVSHALIRNQQRPVLVVGAEA